MDILARPLTVLLVAYVAAYALFGTPEELRRAIKMAYYMINLADVGMAQHGR